VSRPSARPTHASVLCVCLVLTLAALVAALAGAPPSLARIEYVHGGISPVMCEVCHTDNHTNWQVTSEKCLTCHTGYAAPDLPVTCWTCHTPGQDMAAARTDAACTADCHLPDGQTVRHTGHADRSGTCTTCHPVSPSISEAGLDPHHYVSLPPAPTVTGFTPGTGASGTLVTVNGTGFRRVIAVTFGGVPATTFVAQSETQLTVTVPFGAVTGPVVVQNSGGAGASTATFVVPGRVTASLTVAAAPTTLRRGARVTVGGAVKPVALGGASVRLTYQRRSGSRWAGAAAVTVRAAADGSYGSTWLPPRSGQYRVRAALTATAAHTGARSAWTGFRVR
jgi:hypothetical protein